MNLNKFILKAHRLEFCRRFSLFFLIILNFWIKLKEQNQECENFWCMLLELVKKLWKSLCWYYQGVTKMVIFFLQIDNKQNLKFFIQWTCMVLKQDRKITVFVILFKLLFFPLLSLLLSLLSVIWNNAINVKLSEKSNPVKICHIIYIEKLLGVENLDKFVTLYLKYFFFW